MFKNRSMLVKMVKDQPADSAATKFPVDPEEINQIIQESIKNLAIGIVAVAGSLTIIKTASTILINIAPKN